ncbi:G-type lectin S-receptor-like serine/threonine-protein kinase At2g19130 [Macadamia integrifolia]|uniref:G-type lectin S-receptor-like serine/threonine-protein kinase At2g19130 n=1 Tax=Macadamia integrifolia TaxID=60698 RepID=UPI001C529DE2|nr:G-type lectin S-receptor-like serine/threonine-protein kinase At2g19130 [Macadamia integrifolia]
MGTRNRAWFFLSVLFLHFFLSTCISVGASTLSVGQSISADQSMIIVSEENGNSELGLFKPNDNYYYVGIWYRKGEKEIVWVANRDKPLSCMDSSQLKLLEDGNLVILDPSNGIIWSTNLISTSSNSMEAALLDSGNLVLRDVLNSSVLMWESFDHPRDTWLPGGKIGLSKLTNKSQSLTSWRNPTDPAPGLYSLELDPAGSNQLVILWNGFVKWWSSGRWNGNNFSLFPETSGDSIFNFTYVSSQNENYFTYNLYNSFSFSKIVIDVSGEMYRSTWDQPKTAKPLCCNYSCGAFANCRQQASVWCGCLQGFHPSHALSGGCMRNTPLQCVNNGPVNWEKDRFLKMSNLILPTNPQFLAVETAQACELACLNNRSCNAYAYGGGYSVWVGHILSLVQQSDGDTGGQDLYLKLAACELSTSRGNKKGSAIGAIVGAVSGVLALFSLLVVLIWTRQRSLVGPWDANEGFLVPFSYRDLQIVTKNFSEKLGAGGFGSVFKGTLPDSTVVAVKRLEGLNQGEKQFRTEVSMVGTIQHVNLVRLHGFCCEGTRRLLVYDFMPNGSLHSHLFLEKQDPKL